MIPAGILNQSSDTPNAVWYFDFRPENQSKPLSGNMSEGWNTVQVPFDIYTVISGNYAEAETTSMILVELNNIVPSYGGSSEQISLTVGSFEIAGGNYAMSGWMLDDPSDDIFKRGSDRSISLNSQEDILMFVFSDPGTYKMYVNTNIPDDLGSNPSFVSWDAVLSNENDVLQSDNGVGFNAYNRTLESEWLDDPGWYTNSVVGEMEFVVDQNWTLRIKSTEQSGIQGTNIGQIAIEKIS